MEKLTPKLDEFICRQQYKDAFEFIDTITKSTQGDTPRACSAMLQLSHLCTNQRIVKRRAQLITLAEAMCIDPKHAVEERAKLQIVLTTHYIKFNEWNKAQVHVKTLCTMNHDLFTYELLDAIAMEENVQVIGESIPMYLLGNYLMLCIFEGKNNRAILQKAAQATC